MKLHVALYFNALDIKLLIAALLYYCNTLSQSCFKYFDTGMTHPLFITETLCLVSNVEGRIVFIVK